VDRVIDVREALPEEEEEAAPTPGSARKANRGKEKKKTDDASDDSDSEGDDDDDASLQYLVKWRGLGYGEATWEAASSLESETDAAHVARFELRDELKEKKKTYAGAVERAKAGEKPPSKPTPPSFKNGMALREYQVTSFEWMVGNYRRRKNVILGDEMGLGKTAQCISVMEHVRTTLLRAPRPFLVVAPLTTLGHWKREMEKWTNMNVVVLDGNAEDRRVCEETEFYFSSKGQGKGPAKFDVLLVSFETARRLTDTIASFEWALCVVDEAHKLKDVNSQTTQSVMDIPYEWLLLLTGTPIQNNVRELFGMMHVLDPEAYPSWEEFQERFCDGGKEVDATQVMRLRDVLKPRMLRRMKEDVETIPAKEEIVVWVELTPEQRNYYRAIYEKQVHVLLEGAKAKHVPQLRNLCMELRKVCNHPFLCDGLESDYGEKKRKALAASAERAKALAVEKGLAAPPPPPAEPTPLELLVGSSGKMTLVAKLLPKLKSQGKKVLIFSQFTIVLDLLEDYLHEMSYEFERLDGSTSQAERQAGIDRFNTDGKGFVYLLSTRAGGMGITLTAADTAVIYDSDWNPQNDLQAMARCHRIGQTKEVKVYRLVTKATYEQSLFETSAKKYGLDEAVLGGGDESSGGGAGRSAKDDAAKINRLLKYGVHGALRDSGGEEAAAFANEDIDQILGKRAEHRAIGARAGNTFSSAVFAAGDAEEDFDAEDFWAKALPEAARAAKDDKAAFGDADDRFRVTGPRKRKGMYDSYKEGAVGMVGKKIKRRRGDDDDFSGDDSGGSFSDDDDDRATRGAKRASKNAPNKKPVAKKTDAWLDRDLKALEDALVSFGVGVDGACVRATNAALEAMALRRPFKQARAVASCLAEMMERTAKVNKARADELEREQAEARAKAGEAGGAAALARCEVCESMKKGRCGTETAPRSCLKLPPAVAAEMDARGGGVDEGGVPVGMSRATWEQTVEVCEAAIEERRAGIPENALAALERANLYKRLASGWQRAAKCGKERAALSAALEVAVGVEGDDISNVPPAEKAEGDFDGPNVQRGALPAWWSADADAALLRGSLRHGFSPWSAELLDAQFEKIRVDPTLLFAELECAPPEPEGKKREAKQDEPDSSPRVGGAGGPDDASPARMPGRETLKRRLLKLLDCLVRPRPAPPPPKEKQAKPPREAKPRAPTKREQKAAAREAAAVARKAADAERAAAERAAFAAALTGGSKNGDASGMKESPPGAAAATRKASDRLSPETDAAPAPAPAPTAAPKREGVDDAEAPAAKKARATPEKAPSEKAATPAKKAATPAEKAATPAEKAATPAKKAATPAKKAATPAKKAATPEKKAATPAKKAATPAKKAATPAKRSPARARAESPASPASGPARSPLSANAARRSPRPSPRAVAKPAARAVAAAERLAADQDPLATLVLGGGGGGPGSARDSFRTPGAGFKKAGASKTAGAAGKQTSLLGLGFFSKTPAGAGAGAPAARTPTTGGF
jgi:chromodomain-helicase-DNA-binding protein 7